MKTNLAKKLVTYLVLSIIFSGLLFTRVDTTYSQAAFEYTSQSTIEFKKLDQRALILTEYFAQYHSPLQYHAQDFVDAADTYGVDYKLVPAIAGVESTFGKFIPGGHAPSSISYNAWGWGVYGDQSLGFKSWRDGIFTVTGGLKKNYIDKGLTDPIAMNRIYAASPTWGVRVNYFLNHISKFGTNYQDISEADVETNVAADSAQLKQI